MIPDAAQARALQEDAKTTLVDDGFIDITPTDEGYAATARLFVEQIMKDVRKGRQASDREIMISVIEIVAYLGRKNRGDLIAKVTPR